MSKDIGLTLLADKHIKNHFLQKNIIKIWLFDSKETVVTVVTVVPNLILKILKLVNLLLWISMNPAAHDNET